MLPLYKEYIAGTLAHLTRQGKSVIPRSYAGHYFGMDFAKSDAERGIGHTHIRRLEKETWDMGEIILNYDHLGRWIERAEDIRVSRGTSHALSYLIGEKLFNMVSLCQSFRDEIMLNTRDMEHLTGDVSQEDQGHCTNVDVMHENNKRALRELEDMLANFAVLINQTFEPYMIRGYFAAVFSSDALSGISLHRHHDCGDRPAEPPPIWSKMMQCLAVE